MSELRTNRIVPRDGLPSGSSGGIIQVKSTTLTTNVSVTIADGANTTFYDVIYVSPRRVIVTFDSPISASPLN